VRSGIKISSNNSLGKTALALIGAPGRYGIFSFCFNLAVVESIYIPLHRTVIALYYKEVGMEVGAEREINVVG